MLCDCTELGMNVAIKGTKGHMKLPGEVGCKKRLPRLVSDLEISFRRQARIFHIEILDNVILGKGHRMRKM